MEYHLTTPVTAADLAPLRAGDIVYLSGIVYSSRDAAHKRLIELLNEGGTAFAQSDQVGYSTLLNGGYIAKQGAGMSSPTTATYFSFSGYSAVPEPTGGLLTLLGIAGLALRRKRT